MMRTMRTDAVLHTPVWPVVRRVLIDDSSLLLNLYAFVVQVIHDNKINQFK